MKYVLVNCNLFDGNKDSEIVKSNIYVEHAFHAAIRVKFVFS